MKIFIYFWRFYLLTFSCFLFANEQELKIAVASNFFFTAKVITNKFEKFCKCKIILSSDSSSNLYSKIINGADFDIFITADKNHYKMLNFYFETVYSGMSFNGRLSIFAGNKQLKKNFFIHFFFYKKVSVANKNLAPYGFAAFETILNLRLKCNDFVFGNNINQAFIFVKTGNSNVGFVGLSQNICLNTDIKNFFKLPFYLYPEIKQDVYFFNNKILSFKMISFMNTIDVKNLIRNHGYRIK